MSDKQVRKACERNFEQYHDNCSGFVKAVAADLGITLTGMADDIVDQIRHSPWRQLPDGPEARQAVADGLLVIAGLRSKEHTPVRNHGHVAVVVDGELAHGRYPTAWWGRLNSTGSKDKTLNWSWNKTDRDNVSYAAISFP